MNFFGHRSDGDFVVAERQGLFNRIMGIHRRQECNVEIDFTGRKAEDCLSGRELGAKRSCRKRSFFPPSFGSCEAYLVEKL